MIPFTYAVVDDEGEILRQYRWNAKEAKWHKEYANLRDGKIENLRITQKRVIAFSNPIVCHYLHHEVHEKLGVGHTETKTMTVDKKS
jgi:hypothetical protein